MGLEYQDGMNESKIELLNDAFTSFNEATHKLQAYYAHLEEKVKELNLELQVKNRDLEKNLHEKEEVKDYLKCILESLTTGVIVVDMEGKITTFNRAAMRITELTWDDVRGRDFNHVISPLFSEDTIHYQWLKGLKEDFWIEATLMTQEKRPLQLRLSSSTVKSNEDVIIGFMFLLQDITRTKKLEEQIKRTDRLAAMGEIAVSIAHEVRNPLGAIELFASLLRKDLTDNDDGRKLADHIIYSVKSLDRIVSNLLLFTNRQKSTFKEIDVHQYIDDSLLFASHIMKQNNITLIKKYCLKPPCIQGDIELLKQVFINIVFNAVQSMRNGGTLTISTRITNEGFGAKAWKPGIHDFHTGLYNHHCVEIDFADTGSGISDVDMEKIFNPFFTTKERGTGLGLTVVHSILESHGGTIDVESEPGKGTVFTISLPLLTGYATQ
ncbi:MAG: ATP-binding protein [Thermodesulfobacteriota bacterium]|nr:ATP-binding protein [Thermodesulfobacteriota bacterium]